MNAVRSARARLVQDRLPEFAAYLDCSRIGPEQVEFTFEPASPQKHQIKHRSCPPCRALCRRKGEGGKGHPVSVGDLEDPAQRVSCHRLGEGQGIVVMESHRAKVDNVLPPHTDLQQNGVAAFSHDGSGGDRGLHASVTKMDDVLPAGLGPDVGERRVKPPRDQRG